MGGGRPPTLLVPGWSDTARALRHCRAHLLAAGWPETHVASVQFRDRFGSNVEHAAELSAEAARLLRRSGEASLCVVAHSMGGLAVRYWLTETGGESVRTVIFAGTPHRGTWAAWLAWGRGGAEMRPGSRFLRELNARGLPPHVRAHCLMTPFDTRVLPGSSGTLPGAACHVVRLPTHPRLLRHRSTLRLIESLLLDG
jgi:triacylglycerol lipase